MSAIRPAQPADAAAVRAVHVAAFPTPVEADLVERLTANGNAAVSLVAEDASRVVGHVLFSPVTVDWVGGSGLGLAPVAVLPDCQGRGIGSALIRAGLDACRQLGVGFVVVLGGPAYYSRFGFAPGSRAGLANEYTTGDEFMALELVPGALPTGGFVRYGPEFAGVS
jgi:putative acetyltransferase